MKLTFFETPVFSRLFREYLNDDEYRALQNSLMDNPKQGDVIRGTGGFRKMRWEDPRRGKGKRSGLRVIYYYLEDADQIWLFTLYGKSEALDLTAQQKQTMRLAIQAEKRARAKR